MRFISCISSGSSKLFFLQKPGVNKLSGAGCTVGPLRGRKSGEHQRGRRTFDSSERRKLCQNEGEIHHLIHCRALPQWNVMLLMMLGLKPKSCNSCTKQIVHDVLESKSNLMCCIINSISGKQPQRFREKLKQCKKIR